MRFVKTAESIWNIPTGFQRVEYLESTGTQYIDTGCIASNTSGFKVDIMPLQATDKYFIGSRPRLNSDDRFLAGSITGPQVYIGWNTNTYASWELNKVHKVQNNFMNSRTKVLDGTVIAQISETLSSQGTRTVYLFSANDATAVSMDTCRIYKVQISEGSSLVRDFIPCIDSLGVPCMYDLVGKKPYYNQGTGTFTVGRQVIPVEYLESSRTQYIDTGISTAEGICTEAKFKINTITNSNQAVFGKVGITEGSTSRYFFGIQSSTSGLFYYAFNDIYQTNKQQDTNIHTVLFDSVNNILKIDDNSWTLSGDLRTNSETIHLFGAHYGNANNNPMSGRIYYTKIWNNGTLVRDFIPCKDENNVGFMFDTVSGTVYENAGTGAFVVGGNKYNMKLRLIRDNILPTGYTQLEYIEATNANTDIQYAVGNYRLTDTTDWEITFTASAPSNNWVIGQPTWIGVHYRKDTTTSNLPRVGIANSSSSASQCYVDYTDDEKITLALKGTDVYANGVKVGSITRASAGATQTKYGIFGYKDINQDLPNLRIRNARIYRLKIWDNDVLVQDLVPAMKDGVAGFYERVNKTFIEKESNSTSDFTTGKPVLPIVRFPVDPVPVGYKTVNYLESSGSQYIDTGIAPANITPIAKLKFIPTRQYTSGNYGIFGCFGANNTRFQVFYNSIGIGTYVSKSWQADTIYEVELNGKIPSATINGTVETSGYSNANGFSSYNMYLFTRNSSDTADNGVPLKLYYCQITDNNTLVRNFIPVIRLLDNKAGMWDTVTKQFYTTPVGDFITG